MSNADLSGISKLYTDSLKKHGAESQGVGWRDAQSHQLRFDKLAAVVDRTSKTFSVNDLGCGYGALLPYLRESGLNVGLFRGYDLSEEMLEEARRRIDGDNVELIQGAVLDAEADYSFASGIFNVRLTFGEDEWRAHILETLANMHKHSRLGFSFNLLTSYVDWKEPHLYYGDPVFFFDYCKRSFSRYVSLLHDYPLWEWTMIVRKEP
jgi:SAM-dependent methyltransferase